MEVSFSELKEKEIINVYDGKKLGRIIDILFDNSSGVVRGVVVPGEKKVFRKGEDIFVPLEKLKKIGDDVILVGLQVGVRQNYGEQNYMTQNQAYGYYGNDFENDRRMKQVQKRPQNQSYVRYRRIDNKKYK